MATRLEKAGIPVTLITDAAVAHMMERIDLIFVGAEAVVENGGIINKVRIRSGVVLASDITSVIYPS